MPNRTPEQKSHDLEISVIDGKLRMIRIHLEKMERIASGAKEYYHAQNYQKIRTLLEEVIE